LNYIKSLKEYRLNKDNLQPHVLNLKKNLLHNQVALSEIYQEGKESGSFQGNKIIDEKIIKPVGHLSSNEQKASLYL
jgi:hypothetical protein